MTVRGRRLSPLDRSVAAPSLTRYDVHVIKPGGGDASMCCHQAAPAQAVPHVVFSPQIVGEVAIRAPFAIVPRILLNAVSHVQSAPRVLLLLCPVRIVLWIVVSRGTSPISPEPIRKSHGDFKVGAGPRTMCTHSVFVFGVFVRFVAVKASANFSRRRYFTLLVR